MMLLQINSNFSFGRNLRYTWISQNQPREDFVRRRFSVRQSLTQITRKRYNAAMRDG